MAFDLQDPRYKDRSQAAFNVATIIPTVKDPAERQRVSEQLVEVLDHYVEPQEDMLNMYLLLAIGQLGQPAGLDAILKRFESPQVMTREGAVRGVLAWTQSTPTGQPDAAGDAEWVAQREAGKVRAMPHLIKATNDASPMVASEASAAIGELAERGDAAAIEGLKGALQALGPESREVHWNAGVALARLGDEQGAGIVADVLLNRKALAEMSAGETGPAREQRMPPDMQDRVILSTLAATPGMTDERVWIRIQQLADHDPKVKIQSAASQMLMQRRTESAADGRR
jgi:HEAT repeat protein